MKKQHYITLAVIAVIIVAVLIGKNVNREKVVMNDVQQMATSTAASTPATSTKPVATIVQTSSGMIPVSTKPAYIPTLTVEKVTMKLGETKVIGGVTLTIKEIKDTRCFSANKCDTANDARVRVRAEGPLTSKNVSFIEEQGFFVDDIKVILDNVTPEVEKNKTIAETDYRFVIIVESMK
jgi:hypothetical protein